MAELKFVGKFNINDFKKALSGISKMCDEAELRINKDGWVLISASNLYVFNMKIKKEMFQLFNYKEDTILYLNVARFSNLINRLNGIVKIGTDGSRIKVQEEAGKTVEMRLLNEINKIVDPDEYYETGSKIVFDVKIITSIESLSSAIKDSVEVTDGNCIILETSEKGLNLKAEESMQGIKYEQRVSESPQKQIKAKYNPKFIGNILQGSVGNEAVLELKTNYPMKISFRTDYITLEFFLAPIVEEE